MRVKGVMGYNSRPEQHAALWARLKATRGMRARACHSRLIDLFFFFLFEVVSRQTAKEWGTIREPLAVWRPLRQAENKQRTCWIILDFTPFHTFIQKNLEEKSPLVWTDSSMSLRSLTLTSLPPVSSPFSQSCPLLSDVLLYSTRAHMH